MEKDRAEGYRVSTQYSFCLHPILIKSNTHNFLIGFTEINSFQEAEKVYCLVQSYVHILHKKVLITGYSYILECVNEHCLSLDLSTQFERAWGWQGSKGDKKWINVSLSHSLIYFKSKPYLHTAHRQASSAPTSIEIFKTINAVQQQPERVWHKLLLCETKPDLCQSFFFWAARLQKW